MDKQTASNFVTEMKKSKKKKMNNKKMKEKLIY